MPPVKPKIYWHPTTKFRLGNYVKEVSHGGRIDRSEEELVFTDHVFTATIKKEIDHIEKSGSFKNGQIQVCESIKQAATLTIAHNRRKVASMESTAEPAAPIDEKVTEQVSATG